MCGHVSKSEQVKLTLRPAPTDQPWRALWDWLLAPPDQGFPRPDDQEPNTSDATDQEQKTDGD